MQKEWIVGKAENGKSVLEKLLSMRGLKKADEISQFLNPLEIELSQPNIFVDMEKALARIVKAIEEQQNMLIYGDFDADGVTSTSLLFKTLKYLGANVSYFIPDRELHGHGLNSKALVKLMTQMRFKLVLTCDCASSDVEQVAFLNSFKVDTIITDHHETPEILPEAYALINPKAPNAFDESISAKEIENLTALAGVGVAFKLAQSLLQHYEKTDFISEILPFVAVGTVADLVPLIGENRYFVTKGLTLIPNHYGLSRLLEVAGYDVSSPITSENIAFGVAPRINASGRLDDTDAAMKVLTSDNRQEVDLAIISLNNFNKIRQDLCQKVFEEASDMLSKQEEIGNSIILFNPSWHIGIIGIVASKLVEKFYKPTFLMTFSEETKEIRCSSRSIEGVNIYDVLSANADLFEGFGGHSMAGGCSFSVEKTTFETVKKSLSETVDEIVEGKTLSPFVNIDLELTGEDINLDLLEDISKLEPFGMNNLSPVFCMKNLKLKQKKLMGSNQDHLKISVEDNYGETYDCVWWSRGNIPLEIGDKLDVAFSPKLNVYNGNSTIQFMLQDIHSENWKEEGITISKEKAEEKLKFYDQRKKIDIYHQVEDYVKNSKLDIRIFAENKIITDKLENFKSLFDKVFTRKNLEKCDVVMFYDYPPTKALFDDVMKKTSPKAIHFMHYLPVKVNEKDLIKTFSGMIRFACNNKDGNFNLLNCAVYFGFTKKIVELILNAFEEMGLINIFKKSEDFYTINFTAQNIEKEFQSTKVYPQISALINEVYEFKKEPVFELQN